MQKKEDKEQRGCRTKEEISENASSLIFISWSWSMVVVYGGRLFFFSFSEENKKPKEELF